MEKEVVCAQGMHLQLLQVSLYMQCRLVLTSPVFVVWFVFGIIHGSRTKKQKKNGAALEMWLHAMCVVVCVHCSVAVPKPTHNRTSYAGCFPYQRVKPGALLWHHALNTDGCVLLFVGLLPSNQNLQCEQQELEWVKW